MYKYRRRFSCGEAILTFLIESTCAFAQSGLYETQTAQRIIVFFDFCSAPFSLFQVFLSFMQSPLAMFPKEQGTCPHPSSRMKCNYEEYSFSFFSFRMYTAGYNELEYRLRPLLLPWGVSTRRGGMPGEFRLRRYLYLKRVVLVFFTWSFQHW